MAVVFAGIALATGPAPVDAAAKKVVIVVGPTGSVTSTYISRARDLAAQARSYGANVIELYSPNATWSRVKSAARGANVLIYLGHGNGYPSPYGAFNRYTKDGMGLNPALGDTRHKYYGEYYMAQLGLAPNAVVILNHLCYASGNSEPGRADPTKSVAIQRVDNYGYGFKRGGAAAIFAEGHGSARYILYGLFKTSLTMGQIFWRSPAADGRYDFVFRSIRSKPSHGVLDPERPGGYYRSMFGDFMLTTAQWRSGG
ncbi:MAG TPA: hypothetical protein VFV72_12220 [Candidatus Limnocylindrales bacterium]|nr:hypothetical protein [Candidatus Limnocylindrales bacterium]